MISQMILLMAAIAAIDPLTEEGAVNRALANHPSLRAALSAVEEATGEARQAGTPPNPELFVGVEGWRGRNRDDGGHEYLVELKQPLPLSRARRIAQQAGMLGADAAEQDAAAVRLQIASYARTLFYETLVAQKRQALFDAMAADAEALASLTRVRFEAGDLPEMDLMRVVAEQHRYEAERDRTLREYEGLHAQLAELCGLEGEARPECVGAIAPEAVLLPDADVLEARLIDAPGHAAQRLRAEQAEAMVSAVKRSALPEPSLHAGLRRDSDARASSLDLGISIELPLFDRKKGAASAARAREQRIRAENEAVLRNDLRTALALRSEAEGAIIEAQQLRERVLPKLEAASAIIDNAQTLGGATLFETLAARRDIAETRLALLDSENRARSALIMLEALLGQ